MVLFTFDSRTVAFAVLAAAGTSLLFGWAPALHAMRGDLRSAMQDTTAGSTTSPRGRRTLTWLVAAEFTLALVLAVGGVLLFRAFGQVQRVDPGFRPDHALSFSVSLPAASYPDGAARLAFWTACSRGSARRRASRPRGLCCARRSPATGGNFYRIEGRAPLGPGESNPVVLTRVASAGYFEAMGIRLLAGTFFDEQDGRAAFKAEADARAPSPHRPRTGRSSSTRALSGWPGRVSRPSKRSAAG